MLDGADAQRRAGLEGAGKDVRGLERLRVAPLMQRSVGIKGEVDHPIDLAFAVVEANGPRLAMDAGPREGTDLPDPQPAPQHQQKHRAVAQPINHPEPLDELLFAHRFGKTLGYGHMMPAPMNRLLGDQPPLMQEAKETVHDAQEVIDRRGCEALAVGGEEPRLYIGGPGG